MGLFSCPTDGSNEKVFTNPLQIICFSTSLMNSTHIEFLPFFGYNLIHYIVTVRDTSWTIMRQAFMWWIVMNDP